MSQTIKITDKIHARFKTFRDYCVANDVHNDINHDTELLISHLIDRAITTREREIKFVENAKQEKRALKQFMTQHNIVAKRDKDGNVSFVKVETNE